MTDSKHSEDSRNEDKEDTKTNPDEDEAGLKDHCHGGQSYNCGSIGGECKDRLV